MARAQEEPVSALHCWDEGPRAFDDEMSTTCMLPAGHAGDHKYTRDDRITITFAAPEATGGSLAEAKRAFEKFSKEEA